jgi:hypothetical protein
VALQADATAYKVAGMSQVHHFYEKVDLRSRSEMADFLLGHKRYSTMNSWNGTTSVANCIKVHHLDLPDDVRDIMFEALNHPFIYDDIKYVLDAFAEEHKYSLQIGHNGRSGGYLVLYQGGVEPLKYKSRCRKCYQPNYEEVPAAVEPFGRCFKCGKNAVANLNKPMTRTYVLGKGYGEDWCEEDLLQDTDNWHIEYLREEVRFVQSFDKACSDYVDAFIDFCRSYREDIVSCDYLEASA